jgi:putative FmdB family regulatory protein
MPIFEYQCEDCSHEFEALILPGIEARCPQCAGQRLKRLLSQFAVSSDNTRQHNLKEARRRSGAIRKEKDVEQRKYEERVRKEEYGG